ncbi:MAG: hypothetical protein AAGH41_00410 [Pseudomonadota bacterium]
MKHVLLVAASAAALLGAANAAPATVNLLPGYDSTFPGRCGGSPAVDCESAVAEFRKGDNGANASEREVGIGLNTTVPQADEINVSTDPDGLWDSAAFDFLLSYDETPGVLELAIDLDRDNAFSAGEEVAFNVDLAGVTTMYIRIATGAGGSPTTLGDLALDGMALSIPSFSTTTNSYLELSDFTWDADWDLSGFVIMDGTVGSNSRPSVQFKLTDLPPDAIPVPAGVWLFGSAVAAGAARLRKKSA